jgi:hypothetical protein
MILATPAGYVNAAAFPGVQDWSRGLAPVPSIAINTTPAIGGPTVKEAVLFDAAHPEESRDRERRAHAWIRDLADLPERCAGSYSERAAAERIAHWMREFGVTDVSFATVPAEPRAGLVLALHTGLAALGCLWGGLAGTALAFLALWSFRSHLRRRRPILTRIFHPADSINVIGRIGPSTPARRIVLSAHIDAAQAGWLFSPKLADIFARRSQRNRRPHQQPPGPHFITEMLLLAGALLPLASWFGAHGLLFALAKLGVGLALLSGSVLGLQWAFSRATPGANDNASAVAAMLTCLERLLPTLPADVEVWVVGTGAEEVGCVGMHRFVSEHPGWPPESTYFINFECVGGGALHYIRSEGVLGKAIYPPQLLDLARRVAASNGFGTIGGTDLLAGTDGHVPAELGYPTLSLISLEPNGVPRNYHRPNDTADAIDTATVVRSADFGAAVALAALRGDTGPVEG